MRRYRPDRNLSSGLNETGTNEGPAAEAHDRHPARSTQRPKAAAETPRKKIARLKIQASSGWVRSSGADFVIPITLVSGSLKTLNA